MLAVLRSSRFPTQGLVLFARSSCNQTTSGPGVRLGPGFAGLHWSVILARLEREGSPVPGETAGPQQCSTALALEMAFLWMESQEILGYHRPRCLTMVLGGEG